MILFRVIVQVEKIGVIPSVDQITRAKYVGVKNFFEKVGEEDCMQKDTNS